MKQWSQETQGIVELLVPPEVDQAALIDAIGNAWLYVREPGHHAQLPHLRQL